MRRRLAVHSMTPAEEWDEATAELHIGPDGKIRVFGLNDVLMEVLSTVCGNDQTIARRRALARRPEERQHERTSQAGASQAEPPVPERPDDAPGAGR
jgi:hypothetical protein